MLRFTGNALLPAALWLLLCSAGELRAEEADASDGFEPDFHAGAHAHEEPIDPTKRAEMVDKLKKIIETVDANGWIPLDAYVYSEDGQGRPWCALHALEQVTTRVPLMPTLSYEEADYDERTLYDCSDIFGLNPS